MSEDFRNLENSANYLPPPIKELAEEKIEEKVKEFEPKEDKRKRRIEEIKLIQKYLQISYITAQQKYSMLKDTGQLEEIIEKAKLFAEGKAEGLEIPVCPICAGEMKKRVGKLGEFFGCANYPECRGSRPIKSEIVKIVKEQQDEILKKNEITMRFIDEVGGIDQATKWLSIVIRQLSKED
jgi:hypothetical protein